MGSTRDSTPGGEDYELIQWDEESHVAVVGPRDGSDASTFSDAGLTGSPNVLLGFGSLEEADFVPNRETIVVTTESDQPAQT